MSVCGFLLFMSSRCPLDRGLRCVAACPCFILALEPQSLRVLRESESPFKSSVVLGVQVCGCCSSSRRSYECCYPRVFPLSSPHSSLRPTSLLICIGRRTQSSCTFRVWLGSLRVYFEFRRLLMCCLRQCCDGEVQAGFCSSGSLPLLPRGLDSWITRLLRLRVWAPAASASSLWVAFLLCANRLGRQSQPIK